jgi:hypothetical protein
VASWEHYKKAARKNYQKFDKEKRKHFVFNEKKLSFREKGILNPPLKKLRRKGAGESPLNLPVGKIKG